MNYQLRQLEQSISVFLEQHDKTQALLLISPSLRERDMYFSTSKLFIILNNIQETNSLITDLQDFLNKKFQLTFNYAHFNGTIIINENLTKIDFLISSPENLENDLLNIDIQKRDLDRYIIFDKQQNIKEIFNKLQEKNYLEKKINFLINQLLIAIYDFYNYYTKKDFFRTHKYFIQIIETISSLIKTYPKSYHSTEYRNTQLYRFFISFHKLDINQYFSHTQTIEYLKTFFTLLIKDFFPIIESIKTNLEIDINTENIKDFLNAAENKFYPISNFRDIATIPNYCEKKPILRYGQVFRSAMLDISDSQRVYEILDRYNIKTIIDLREDDFMEYNQMSPMDLSAYHKINIPISYIKMEQTIEFVKDEDFYKNLYYGHLEFFSEQIGKALKAVNENLTKGAVLIHCSAGKDRTGIIVAFLQKIAGVSNQCIIEDYLASFADTRKTSIEYFISLVENHYQGWHNYLINKAKLSNQIINELKEKLTN